jgi:hypothetical protein
MSLESSLNSLIQTSINLASSYLTIHVGTKCSGYVCTYWSQSLYKPWHLQFFLSLTSHRWYKHPYISVISGFCCNVDEICTLLGYNAASNGNPLLTFQDNVSVPSSSVQHIVHKMLVKNYHSTLCNTPQECRSHQYICSHQFCGLKKTDLKRQKCPCPLFVLQLIRTGKDLPHVHPHKHAKQKHSTTRLTTYVFLSLEL